MLFDSIHWDYRNGACLKHLLPAIPCPQCMSTADEDVTIHLSEMDRTAMDFEEGDPLLWLPWNFYVRETLRNRVRLDLRTKKLMSRSTIEPNGLHYPDEWTEDGIVRIINGTLEPSPCYFAGCVPNMSCKVEAYEKYCAEQYEPTNLDDLEY